MVLREFKIPLPCGQVALFTVPCPMEEEDYQFFVNILAMLKPGLVTRKPIEQTTEG